MFKRFLPSDMGKLTKDIVLTMGVIFVAEYAIKYAVVYGVKYAACKFLGYCAKVAIV